MPEGIKQMSECPDILSESAWWWSVSCHQHAFENLHA